MKNFVIATWVVFALASCSYNTSVYVDKPSSGKLFIIGGGSRPASLIQKLIDVAEFSPSDTILILPMASAEIDTSVFYSSKQFTELGCNNVYSIITSPNRKLSDSEISLIAHSKIIYITGGDQNRFMSSAVGTGLEKLIREAYYSGATIAGTSAGASLMSDKMISGNQHNHREYSAGVENIEENNVEIVQGLGLIKSAIIDQHFVKRMRYNRLISTSIEYPHHLSIGIDEGTALIIDNYHAEVFGMSQVVCISNPMHSNREYNGKIGARGLKLDVFLPGESFDLRGY